MNKILNIITIALISFFAGTITILFAFEDEIYVNKSKLITLPDGCIYESDSTTYSPAIVFNHWKGCECLSSDN